MHEIERRADSIELTLRNHTEEIGAMRVIQAQQQTLMANFALQRTEDKQGYEKLRAEDRAEAIADRKVLTGLVAKSNRLMGMLYLTMFLSPILVAAANLALRYWLFGHPLSEGGGGIIKQ